MEKSSDKRILVLSNMGCAPPFMGNRLRLRSLLKEIRNLGFEIHFAGIRLSDIEIESTHPFIDEWVTNFQAKSSDTSYRNSRAFYFIKKMKKLFSYIWPEKLNFDIDTYFDQQWVDEIRKIQKEKGYNRVMVVYVFYSAFLDFFESADIKIIDTHDVFAERNKMLKAKNISSKWFSTSEEEEKKGLLRANRIISIQEKEESYFKKLVKDKATVKTVRHFIEPIELPFNNDSGGVYGFIGSSNPLNVDAVTWFIKEVLPAVKESAPESMFVVAGTVCSTLEKSGDYKLIGNVDNVEEFYKMCKFTVNPMRAGTGLKIKTVESLSFGRPVVGTPIAAEGLGEFAAKGIAICHTRQQFIRGVLDHLQTNTDISKHIDQLQTEIRRMNKRSKENLFELLS